MLRPETDLIGRDNLQRILAIRLDNIGDVIMLGPALRSLRAALPMPIFHCWPHPLAPRRPRFCPG
jgi:hypothetical protein